MIQHLSEIEIDSLLKKLKPQSAPPGLFNKVLANPGLKKIKAKKDWLFIFSLVIIVLVSFYTASNYKAISENEAPPAAEKNITQIRDNWKNVFDGVFEWYRDIIQQKLMHNSLLLILLSALIVMMFYYLLDVHLRHRFFR